MKQETTVFMKPIENLIIVAHPDDEFHWFSSVLNKPNTAIVFCFQNKYPDSPCLLEYVTGVFQVMEYYYQKLGIPVFWLQTIRTMRPIVFGKINPQTRGHLRTNLRAVLSVLNPKYVYTHNPWGSTGIPNTCWFMKS